MTLARAGDVHEAALKFLEARRIRETADALDGLSQTQGRGKARGVTAIHPARLRMSEARESTNRLTPVARAAGYTLASLAEAVAKRTKSRFSHSILSKAPRGDRPVRSDVAALVQELTRSDEYPKGYEATPANWPGGITPHEG